MQRLQKELTEYARQRLGEFVPRARNVKVHTRVLAGVPDVALLSHAERCKADLIVLANRGHSPIEGLLIGSTAERVLRSTTLPVLLVSVPRAGD